MRKSLFVKIVVCVLCIVTFAAVLVACGDGTGKPSSDMVGVPKPDIATALNDYSALTTKKSSFTAEMKITLYRQMDTRDPAVTPLSITQVLDINRTLNNNKIYAEGKLYTSSDPKKTDSLFDSTYRLVVPQLMNFMGASYDLETDPILLYLAGKSYFGVKLGYDNGVYNVKGEYNDGLGGEVPARNKFWGATDNNSIDNLIDSFNVHTTFHPSDYLMMSGILDLTNVSSWLLSDISQSKYFSTSSERFIYNYTGDPTKIKNLAFSFIRGLATYFDAEEYVDDVEKVMKVLPIVENWFSVGPTGVDARVFSNGLPDHMDTSIAVNLNVNLKELEEQVLAEFMDADDRQEIAGLLNLVANILGFRGNNGELNTIGITFSLDLSENFSYDAASCDLSNVDGDLYLALNEARDGRFVFDFPKGGQLWGDDE